MKSILIILTITLAILAIDAKKTVRSATEGDVPVIDQASVESKCKSKDKYNKYEAETHVKRCPPGWSRFKNEKCFKISPETEPAVNHDGAETACELLGSTLASVSSEAEKTFLESLLLRDTADETTLRSLWIGLRRKFGKMFWYDLTEGNFSSLTNTLGTADQLPWSPSAASMSLVSGNDCGLLATDGDTMANKTEDFGRITFAACDELKGFVCQKFITEKGSCCS